MTQTNYLAKISQSDLQSTDLLRLFSSKNGGDAGVTLTNLAAFFASITPSLPSGIDLERQYASPSATGFSVTIVLADTWLILTPAAGYAAGEIVLPSAMAGQSVMVNSTQAVTALTITPNGADSVVGVPTTLAANDYFTLRYDDVLSRWYRVG